VSGPGTAWGEVPVADVRIGEEAEAEYKEALAWYQARSVRAADGFEAAFAKVLDRIRQSPEQFPTCAEAGYRFAMLDRYPYSLVYRVIGDVAQVIAVAHSRRRPGYWSRRI
jgi:plasmid stabilization system protein ParE